MTVVSLRSVLAVLLALIGFAAPLLAQSLQPSKTGLPGRTVWALTTSATGSGAARQTFTFAATDKGLWKSADNGGVWTEVPALKNQEVYAVKARRVGNTTTLLAATKKGILRSQDGGTTWASPEVTTGTVVSTSNILELKKVFDIEIVNSTWYAATEKGVFRSTNDGRSWTLLNIDRSVDNNEVRGITAEGSTIIVNLWKEGLWRSTNNGGSWAKLSITGETSLSKTVAIVTGTTRVQRGNTLTTATVSMVFVGAVSGNLWRSLDNGTSWTKILAAGAATRTTSNVPTGIDAFTSSGTRIIGSTPKGFAVSENFGMSWEVFNTSVGQAVSILAHEDRRSITLGLEQSPSMMAADGKNTSLSASSSPGAVTYGVAASSSGQACPVNVTGFTPASLPAGSGGTTIIINGQNFPSSDISFFIERVSEANNSVLGSVVMGYNAPENGVQVVYQSPTSVALTLPASWFTVPARIGVNTATTCPTSGLGFTFYVTQGPTLTGPTTPLLRTGLAQNITLTGTNFISGTTKVYYSLNGGTRTELTPVTVSSPTSLGVSLPATALTATGTIAFTAENTAASPSAALNVLVHNPPPTIQSVSPLTYTRNSNNPITITGTGFVPESRIRLDNSTGAFFIPTYLSPTQVRFSALSQYNTGGAFGTATSFQLLVDNPVSANNQGGGLSANVSIPIVNPAPNLSGINPLQIFTGQQATIALSASSLMANTVAQFNNKTYTIAPAGFSQTAIIIPPEDLTTTGSYPITLFTPAPGGGTSQQVFVSVVHPQPAVSSIAPTTVNAGREVTVTITGSSFVSSAVVYMESGATALATTFVSATSLRAVVPANRIPTNGTYRFYVVNPTPNGPLGGTSGFVNLTVNTPVANLTGINPATLTASGSAQTLTLTGTFFETNAVAWISGTGITTQALTTTVQNAGLATATVPADLAGRAGTYTITLRNPNAPDSQTQALTIQNPAATLQTLMPASATAGGGEVILTLTGTNFVSGAVVVVNGTPLTPSSLSAGTITVIVPASSFLVAGTRSVLVRNPAPSAGDSPTLSLAVNNPVPTLAPLAAPTLTVRDGQAQTVVLTGTGFNSASVVVISTGAIVRTVQPTLNSASQLTLTIPADLTGEAGVLSLVVQNPAPVGGSSVAQPLYLLNPAPSLTSITPTLATAGDAATTLSLAGTAFVRASEVVVRRATTTGTVEQTFTPTFIGETQLLCALPATLLTHATTFTVLVRTTSGSMTFAYPTGGTPSSGGISAAQTFTVQNPAPVLTSITPTQTRVLQTTTLTLTGTRFVVPDDRNAGQGAVVFLNGTPLQTTVVSATEITATIPAALLPNAATAAAQTYALTVRNPVLNSLGGGASNAIALTVVNPAATITALQPVPVPLSATPLLMTLSGTDFITGATVRITNTVLGAQTLTSTVVSAGTLTVSVPASYLSDARTNTLTVHNPQPSEGVSNNFDFVVENPVPALTGITPTTATIQSADLPFTLTGSAFAPSVKITITDPNGTQTVLSPQTIAATTLSLALPPALSGTAGTYRVMLLNPPVLDAQGNPQGGGTSATLSFVLRNPAPTLTAAAPNIMFAGTTATMLTLTGANLLAATRVLVNGFALAQTDIIALSRTQLQAVLPASFLVSATTLSVRVQNLPDAQGVGGGTSSAINLAVRNADPTLASVSPARTVIASSSVVTVFGSGLSAVSQFRLRLGTISTVSLPILSLTAPTSAVLSIPAAAISTLGTYQLTAVNPAPFGGSSNVLNFIVGPASAVSCEFVNVTTAVIAGSSMASFSVRLRDSFGNLTDSHTVSSLNFTESTGTSSGTILLTRTGVGVMTFVRRAFHESGQYILWIQGISTTTGSRSFVVGAATDNRVTFAGVPSTTASGTALPPFTLRFEDAFGNLTDNGIGRLTYTKAAGAPVSTATLALTRLSEGVYAVPSTTCTIAGRYTLAMSSVTAPNTFGTKIFEISSLAAVSVTFSGVSLSLNAGQQQALFDVRFRDVYGNNTDTGIASVVGFSNATTANVGASSGTIAIYRRLGIGLYEVTRATFTTAGNYTLSVNSLQNTGHRFFRLLPATTVRFVDFVSLPPNVYTTAEQTVSVFYRDAYNNAIENNRVISFTKMGGAPASTGTLSLSEGTLTGETIATFSKITMPGAYTLTVSGMTPVSIRTLPGGTGLPTIQVYENEGNITNVCFELPQPRFFAGQSLPPFTAQYFLNDGNPSITHPRTVRYQHTTLPDVRGTFTMRRIGTGRSQSASSPVFTTAGTYSLSVEESGITPSCTTSFEVLGGTAASIVAVSVPTACITAGQALTPLAFEVRDRWGNLTNEFNNDALVYRPLFGTFTATPNASTGTMSLTTATTGILTETVPSRVFTTAGTYSLEVPIYYIENRVASTTLTFCVAPGAAAIAGIDNITPTIPLNGTQTPVLTVRDRWSNLTEYTETFTFSGAANGTIPLTQRSIGIYDGAVTVFSTSGNYTLAAGALDIYGTAQFTVSTPRLNLTPPLSVIENANITQVMAAGTTITRSTTITLTFQDLPNNTVLTLNAPPEFLLRTAQCAVAAQTCQVTVSGAGTEQIFVDFVRTPATLAGLYTGSVQALGATLTTSANVRSEAYSGGTAFPDPPKISVMTIYTHEALRWLGILSGLGDNSRGTTIQEYLRNSIDISNQANRNSGVNIRFSLDPVVFATDATVNLNGTSQQLTQNLRNTWDVIETTPCQVQLPDGSTVNTLCQFEEPYTLRNIGTEILWNAFNDANSFLSRLRDSFQADQVLFLGAVPFSFRAEATNIVTGQVTEVDRRIRSIGGHAGTPFTLEVNRSTPFTMIYAHEIGHNCGASHHYQQDVFDTPDRGVIFRYTYPQPVVQTTIDYGAYSGGRKVFTAREIEAFNTPSVDVVAGTIMAQFNPRVPYWSNPNQLYTPADAQATPVFLRDNTGTLPANIANNANMTARMNSGNGGGQTVASTYQEHITYIDVSISGARTLVPNQVSRYRANVVGALARRPFSYRWFVRPATATQQTQVSTSEFLDLTATDRETRIRVEVTDAENKRITAEAFIACPTCPQTLIALNKEVSKIASEINTIPGMYEPAICGEGLHPSSTATLNSMSKTNAQSHSVANELNTSLKKDEKIQEFIDIRLGQNYPNPCTNETKVNVVFPKEQYAKLALFDMLGNEIGVIAEGIFPIGRSTIEINVQNLPAGIYGYRLYAGGKILNRQMIHTK